MFGSFKKSPGPVAIVTGVGDEEEAEEETLQCSALGQSEKNTNDMTGVQTGNCQVTLETTNEQKDNPNLSNKFRAVVI